MLEIYMSSYDVNQYNLYHKTYSVTYIIISLTIEMKIYNAKFKFQAVKHYNFEILFLIIHKI